MQVELLGKRLVFQKTSLHDMSSFPRPGGGRAPTTNALAAFTLVSDSVGQACGACPKRNARTPNQTRPQYLDSERRADSREAAPTRKFLAEIRQTPAIQFGIVS